MKTLHTIALFFIISFVANGQNDTLNKTDSEGLKQGYWVVKNGVKKLPNYSAEAIVEEGWYSKDKKEGIWKMYYPSGKIRSEITFKNNRPYGYVKMYYKDGNIQEEGIWKNNRWEVQYVCDTSSKKNSSPPSYHQQDGKPFNGKGYAKLYNSENKISKEGTFKNFRLMDGKDYTYNDEDILERISVYKDGKYINDEPIDTE